MINHRIEYSYLIYQCVYLPIVFPSIIICMDFLYVNSVTERIHFGLSACFEIETVWFFFGVKIF